MSSTGTLLGIDVGSSSIKVSLVDAHTGKTIVEAISPDSELPISVPKPGFAEQHPELWWEHASLAINKISKTNQQQLSAVQAVGIAYQMHGLVLLDAQCKPLRPAIIWCDSRAVPYGEKAFNDLGKDQCLSSLLNSPGNFTVAKLAWVKENEKDIYKAAKYAILPGDYIAFKLTGEIATSIGGLSEGMAWNFAKNQKAQFLFDYFGIPTQIFPNEQENVSVRGTIRPEVAKELGIPSGIPVAYCAGDQPNNAFALNVLDPGEIAVNAGTSGVVFAVTEKPVSDPEGRINTFAHVNYTKESPKYGVLLCINGTAIANRWLKQTLGSQSYEELNKIAALSEIGAKGLKFFPYGNGAERTLKNKNPNASLRGLDFNLHQNSDIARAVQEGIAFALTYGVELAKDLGVKISKMRAGFGNMFLSPLFGEIVSNVNSAPIELYDTSGATGAALGAGVGAKVFKGREEAFRGLHKKSEIIPQSAKSSQYREAYASWKQNLEQSVL